ncbi:MAG: class I SAM-dependent methyltransferase [Nanoarchaeota archaeon]
MTLPLKIISAQEYLKENPKPNQEQVWDSISNPWKEYRVGKLPVIVEFLKDKKGKIVDLGCGSGRNMIKNNDIEYYGVDFSENQIKHAEKYIKEEKIKAKLFKAFADNLPSSEFKKEMFDYGLFIATLHCLESKKQREDALKEFYRVLKSGAEALISVWDSEDERFNGLKGDIYMSWKEDNIPYMRYYYLYEKEELIDLLEKIGFKILEVYTPKEKDRFSRKNLIFRIRK